MDRTQWVKAMRDMITWDSCSKYQRKYIASVLATAALNPYCPTSQQLRLIEVFYKSLSAKEEMNKEYQPKGRPRKPYAL